MSKIIAGKNRLCAAFVAVLLVIGGMYALTPRALAAEKNVTSYTTNEKAQNARNFFFIDFGKVASGADTTSSSLPAKKLQNGDSYIFTEKDGLPAGYELEVTVKGIKVIGKDGADATIGLLAANKTWNAIFESNAELFYGETGYTAPAASKWIITQEKSGNQATFKVEAKATLDGQPVAFDFFATDGESSVRNQNTDAAKSFDGVNITTNAGNFQVVQDLFSKDLVELVNEYGYFDIVDGSGTDEDVNRGGTADGFLDFDGNWFTKAGSAGINGSKYEDVITESDARLWFDSENNWIVYPKTMSDKELRDLGSTSRINPHVTTNDFDYYYDSKGNKKVLGKKAWQAAGYTTPAQYQADVAKGIKCDNDKLWVHGRDGYTAKAMAFYIEAGWADKNYPTLNGYETKSPSSFAHTMHNVVDAIAQSFARGEISETEKNRLEALATKYGLDDTNKGFLPTEIYKRNTHKTSTGATPYNIPTGVKNLDGGEYTGPVQFMALQNQPVLLSHTTDKENGLTIDAKFGGNGSDGLIAGIFLPTDSGDAPASYGQVSHILRNWELYGQRADAREGIRTQPAGWKIKDDGPYIGRKPAHDDTGHIGGSFGADYEEDLNSSIADQRGDYPQPYLGQKGYTAVIPVRVNRENTDKVYVASWIDFDDNGKFDDDSERAYVEIDPSKTDSSGNTYIKLDWPKAQFTFKDDELKYGGYAIRTRIASGESGKAALEKPTAERNEKGEITKSHTAADGEVEDLIIQSLSPKDAETYGPQGVAQTSNENTSFGNSTDTRDKGVKFEQMFPHIDTVAQDLANEVDGTSIKRDNKLDLTYKLDPAFGKDAKNVVKDEQAGTLTYTNDKGEKQVLNADGTVDVFDKDNNKQGTYKLDQNTKLVSFIPEKDFAGDPEPITVVAVVGNVAEVPAVYTPHVDPTTLVVPPAHVTKNPSETADLMPIDVTANEAKAADDVTKIDLTTVAFDKDLAQLPENSVISADGTTLTVPGQGIWTLVKDTHGTFQKFTFTPEAGFVGDPTPVAYTAKNVNGVDAKEPAELSVAYRGFETHDSVTQDEQGKKQFSTDTTTEGDAGLTPAQMFPTVHELADSFKEKVTYKLEGADGSGAVIAKDSKGEKQGTYTINQATGVVTFTPEPAFVGKAEPVTVLATGLKDAEGKDVEISATYTPIVTPKYINVHSATETGTIGSPVTVKPEFDEDVLPSTAELTLDNLPQGSKFGENSDRTSNTKEVIIPGQGTWTVDNDGKFTFTPEPGFADSPTPVQYFATDENGVKSQNQGLITAVYPEIKPSNSKTIEYQGEPQHSNDKGTTGAGTDDGKKPAEMFNGLNVDQLPSAWKGTVGFTLINESGEAVSEIVVPEQGKFTIDKTTGEVTFTPEPGFVGNADTVTVSTTGLKDAQGNDKNYTATYTPKVVPLTVTVPDSKAKGELGKPVSQTPQFAPEQKINRASINLTTDGLPEGSKAEPDGKTVKVPGQGTWTVAEDGMFTFTPDKGFSGDPTPIQYTATNENGVPSTNKGKVSIEYPVVTPVPATTTGPQGVNQLSTDKDSGDHGKTSAEMFPGVPATNATYSLLDKDGKSVDKVEFKGHDGTLLGTYTIDSSTGVVTFDPEGVFVGRAEPVRVQMTTSEENNLMLFTSTYTPIVEKVEVPALSNTVWAEVGKAQSVTPAYDNKTKYPDDPVDPESVIFVDAGVPVGTQITDGGKKMVVPGEGTWSIDKTTGEITFTPEEGFTGSPQTVSYKSSTRNGVPVAGFGKVTVLYPVNAETIDQQGVVQKSSDKDADDQGKTSAEMFPGAKFAGDVTKKYALEYADANGKVVKTADDGSAIGEYAIDSETGDVTFTPDKDFVGVAPGVTVIAHTSDGDAKATYTPTVKPNPVNATSIAEQGAKQQSTDKDTGDNGKSASEMFPGFDLQDAKYQLDGAKADGTKVVDGQGKYEIDESTGVVTFTPLKDFAGEASPATIIVTTKNGETAKATYTPTVLPKVKDAEKLGNVPGTNVTVTPTYSNSIDPTTVTFDEKKLPSGATLSDNGKKLKVPGEGTWTIDKDGNFTFDPEEGYKGQTPSVVTYKAKTASGVESSNAGSVTVTYLDPKPLNATTTESQGKTQYSTDKATGDKGVTTSEMFPVVHLEGATFELVGAETTGANKGKVVVKGEGVYQIDSNTGVVTFTPEPEFTGEGQGVTVKVTLSEENSKLTYEAQYTPTVTEVNIPLNNASAWGETGKSATITPAYGKDSNGTDIDKTSVTFPSEGQPSGVTVSDDGKSIKVPNQGTWTVDQDGVFTFTPTDGFTGTPTPVKYTAKNTDGVPSKATGTVSAFYPVNATTTGPQGKKQYSDDKGEGDKGVTVQEMFPKANLSGASYQLDGSSATAKDGSGKSVGTYTIDANGKVTFTPEPTFVGTPTPAVIVAKLKDGSVIKATYTPTVTEKDVPLTPATSEGNTPGKPVSLTPNYEQTIDKSTVTFEGGSKTKTVKGEGTWKISNDGTFTFTPEPGFKSDPTPVNYTAKNTDGVPAKTPSTVTVKYTTVTTVDATTIASEGEEQHSTDKDKGDAGIDARTMFPVIDLDGASYALKLKDGSAGKSLTVDGEGTYTIDSKTGKVTFTPVAGFVGEGTGVSVQVTTAKSAGSLVYEAKYTPTVTPQIPDASEKVGKLGKPATATPNYSKKIDKSTVTFEDGSKTKTVKGEGTWKISNDGTFTFTPEKGYAGSPTPVKYIAKSTGGIEVQEPGTVTVTYPALETHDALTYGDYAKVQHSNDPNEVKGENGLTAEQMFPNLPLDGATYALLDSTGKPVVDENGNPLTTLTVEGEGTYVLDPATGTVTFTPAKGFYGVGAGVQVQVTTSDENGRIVAKAKYQPIVAPEPEPDDKPGMPSDSSKQTKPDVAGKPATTPQTGSTLGYAAIVSLLLVLAGAAAVTARRRFDS